MNRFTASVCLAGMLAVSVIGCASKPEQTPAPPAAGGETAQPGADIRARAEAGRQKADEARSNADQMRDAAGAGSGTAAAPAPAASPAPTGGAAAGATPGSASPTYAELPGGEVREGGATARSRADTMRSRASRARTDAGGSAAPLPPPPATSAQTTHAPSTAAAPAPPAAAHTTSPAAVPAAAAGPAPVVQAGHPVDANELAALLPSMSSPWSKGRVDANTLSSPAVFSQARVTYRQGSAYVRIEIVDAAGSQAALAQFTATLPKGSSKAGKDGYERRATFAGYPSWEAWRGSDQHGTLNVLIGNRFLVSYTGHGIESAQVLSDLAQRTDLKKFETLR
jgi:hypothetical protein